MKSVWVLVALAATIDAEDLPEIRFRVEGLRGSGETAAAKPAEFGVVNRVRYRVAPGAGVLAVEREAVAAPDPQEGTLVCPEPLPGAPWTRAIIPADPGSNTLDWGDFSGEAS